MFTTFDVMIAEKLQREVYNRLFDTVSGNREIVFPSMLYRYRPITKYAEDDFVNNKVSLAAPNNMNDIFDSMMIVSSMIKHDLNSIDFMCEKADMDRNELNDIYSNIWSMNANFHRDILRIGCFSEVNDSVSMWGHYADSYRGICIEYPIDCFNKLIRAHLYPVIYNDVIDENLREKIEYEIGTKTADEWTILLGIYCQSLLKKREWSAEREWRLMFDGLENDKFPSVLVQKNPSALYLGAKCDSDNLSDKEIDILASMFEFCRKEHIAVFQMEADYLTRQLVKKPIDLSNYVL